MPTSTEILDGLSRISNQGFAVAVVWHVLVAVALLGLLVGWRPSARRAATLLAVPLASASAFAWIYGNVFNGALLIALAMTLSWLGAGAPHRHISRPAGWSVALGAGMVLFAWIYPHFLVDRPWAAYLYGAPIGLIPCPTLSLVVGLALLTGNPGGRAFGLVLSAGALFYALFGVLRLGVWLDMGLLVGAVGLLVSSLRAGRHTRRTHPHAPRLA